MIVPFTDTVAGTTVYINPVDVATLRPDPEAPERGSVLKFRDGEVVRVQGDHETVADKLARAA